MSSILTSSIFLLFFSSFSVLAKTPESTAKAKLPQVGFLEQAEDVEREAWWVLTGTRASGASSPFRVLRAAFLFQNKKNTTRLHINFCKKLKVVETLAGQLWRIDSECQKKPLEVGSLQKITTNTGADSWKLQWSMSAFGDHFGLGASILFVNLNCLIQLNHHGRISEMSCPFYARNRNGEEIVELSEFEFKAEKSSLLKLKGEVKKNLEKIATIETTVPLSGEIVVKEKQVPTQKMLEEQAEFSNSKKVPPRVQEKTDGQKEKNGEKDEGSQENQNSPQQKKHAEGVEGQAESGEVIQPPEGSETPPISEPQPAAQEPAAPPSR